MMTKSRRRFRVPGVRGRVALAVVAAVAAACAALTITTTTWVGASHRESQKRLLLDSVSRDTSRLFAALKEDPSARTMDELLETSWTSEAWEDGAVVGEAILIPMDGDKVDPEKAIQSYVVYDAPKDIDDWTSSYLNTSGQLSDRFPSCLQPADRPQGPLLLANSAQSWTEMCGPYLVAFGIAQPGIGSFLGEPWMVVRALYLPAQHDPVPALAVTLVVISVIIVALSALVARRAADTAIRPLTRAGAMADAVATGDLSARIPVEGDDDVATMSRAVNTMADRLTGKIADLERVNEAQRRIVSDVAHELRTPTAALLASAEALRDPRTRDEAAALVAPQLSRLARLTEDLLEISRIDAGRAGLLPARVDLVDLIRDTIADVAAFSGPDELWTTTDPIRVQAVLRNLLTNAAQHGAPPTTVTLTSTDDTAIVEVHDGGAGVPVALRDRVFDRFVRGDESRHGSSSGLGLAIAAENARLLGGTLGLADDGVTFRLTLPLADRQEEEA
ncbi:MAG: HAMP domain-containing sensor histidine kinase [Arachnia sp.]